MKDLKKSIDAIIICAKKIPPGKRYNYLFENVIDCLRKLQNYKTPTLDSKLDYMGDYQAWKVIYLNQLREERENQENMK